MGPAGLSPRQSFGEKLVWCFYPPPGAAPSGSKRSLADDFPVLEVAAAFGALAAGIRAYQLIQASKAIPRLGAEISIALRSGHPGRARELSQKPDAYEFGNLGDAALDTLDASGRLERGGLAEELRRVMADELASFRARLQSARARDLLVALVLMGAIFYAARSGLGRPAFYVLAAGGAVLAASGVVLRPRLLHLVERQSEALIEAALATSDKTRGLGADPCPSCGGAEAVVVDAPRVFGEPAAALGLQELRICRQCGYVQGSVSDPGSIPLGAEHGTSLSATAVIPLEETQVEATEHEG